MTISEPQLLDALNRTPFVDSTELALMLGEPHATVHRVLVSLLADGIAGRVSHGHRPLAVEPEIPPDGPGRRRSRLGARLCHALGLCAGLPHVQGVADAAHPQDGRGGQRLPTRSLDVPRHRRPPVSLGVPPQGALRRHHHPPRRPQLRRGAPGPCPAAPVPLRPAEGHRAVRPRASSRHRADACAQHMGAAKDGEVLPQQRSP